MTNALDKLREALEAVAKATPAVWRATETASGKGKVVDAGGFSICNTTAGPYDQQRADAAAIVAAVNWLRDHGEEIARRLEDSARLDWLEARGCFQFQGPHEGRTPDKRWFDTETVGSDYSPTLRGAIDAAMAPATGCKHNRSDAAPWRCAKCGTRLDDSGRPIPALAPSTKESGNG